MQPPTSSRPSREATLSTSSTLHRWSTSRLQALLLFVLVFTSCSSLFGERAEPVNAKGEPIEIEPPPEAVYTGPQTIEEEFPFIRFIDHFDGTYTALITVPSIAGIAPEKDLPIEATLKKYIPALADEGGTATMERKQGFVFHSDNKVYSSAGKFDPVEEVLVIQGDEAVIRDVLTFIDIWMNSGPLVEIQAEVFETKRSDEFERGVEQIGTDPLFQDVQGQTFLKSLTGIFPSDSNTGGVFSLGLLDSSFRVDAAVSLLAKEGFVDVLSRPRIVTRNGVAAVVKSTEQIPYLSVTSAGNLAGAATFSVQRSPVGVTLAVTPFLIGADTVHLVINVDVSTLGRDFDLGVDGIGNRITAPSLSSRSAQTEVYVRNGETVVIGGLILNDEQYIENKIPILGDLPLLGWLFSSRSESIQKTEVFFIITPRLKDRPSIDRFGDFFDPFAEQQVSE